MNLEFYIKTQQRDFRVDESFGFNSNSIRDDINNDSDLKKKEKEKSKNIRQTSSLNAKDISR